MVVIPSERGNPMSISVAGVASRTLAVFGLIGGFSPRAAAQLPEVALERRLAHSLDARVGDTVTVLPAQGAGFGAGVPESVIVVAIYEAPPDPSLVTRREYHLRFHLPDLAGRLGVPDRVDRIGVALIPGVPADSAARVFNRLAFGFRAYPSAAIASESSQTFRVVSRFHRAIAVISIVGSAVFLLCIMLLKVEERRLDAAVMRFIGIRRRTIFVALLLEACLVAAAGSAAGVALAWLAGSLTNAYYRRYFDTSLIFSLITSKIVLFSVALSLALGLLAGAAAAWRLVKTRPMVLWGRG